MLGPCVTPSLLSRPLCSCAYHPSSGVVEVEVWLMSMAQSFCPLQCSLPLPWCMLSIWLQCDMQVFLVPHQEAHPHISIMDTLVINLSNFFPLCFWAAIQEIHPNLELPLFPHKVDNQVHWSQFHPMRKFSLFAVFQGHSCSVAIAHY